MKYTPIPLSSYLPLLALAACATGQQSTNAVDVAETICREPRPEVCTMDYRPVCAHSKSGDYRTYSNACGACADAEVIAYVRGACE